MKNMQHPIKQKYIDKEKLEKLNDYRNIENKIFNTKYLANYLYNNCKIVNNKTKSEVICILLFIDCGKSNNI